MCEEALLGVFSYIQYWGNKVTLWMVYSLVVRALGLEYGGREFESRSLHLRPETKLREERVRAKIASNLVISDCVSDSRYKR